MRNVRAKWLIMPSVADADELTPVVYRELRQIAAAYLRRERPGQTLQATALVHEAYLRLAGAGSPWQDERHFVGIASNRRGWHKPTINMFMHSPFC